MKNSSGGTAEDAPFVAYIASKMRTEWRADRLDYRRGVLPNAVTNRIIRIGRSGTIIIDAETAPTSITLIPRRDGPIRDKFGRPRRPVGQQCSGGNLGANVEMQKLKATKHSFRLKPLRDAQYLRRREPKLALLAGSRPKMTGVLGPQLRPHPGHRSNPDLPTDFDNHSISSSCSSTITHYIFPQLQRPALLPDVPSLFTDKGTVLFNDLEQRLASSLPSLPFLLYRYHDYLHAIPIGLPNAQHSPPRI
ncbi:hypothetical protein Scep_006488 [Stephania cephalantha]|uniref:Uncharacterized protein n=1 Tax=Stephania cephalantha TaxID=152367 RepID=A0AAP0PP30_9MAGN